MRLGTMGLFGVLGLLTIVAFSSPAAASTGALAGIASLNLGGCPPDVVHFFATNVDDDIWKYQVGVGCTSPKLLFQGPWNPTTGGCVPGSSVVGKFCVGPVSQATPAFTSVELCVGQACQTGSATVERA